jgi:hypothetical protein
LALCLQRNVKKPLKIKGFFLFCAC